MDDTEKLHRFFELSRSLLCLAGTDGRLRRVNPAMARTLGYAREELLELPFAELACAEDLAATRAQLDRLARDAAQADFENRCRCRDGSIRKLAWRAVAEPGEDLLYISGYDITDRDRVEGELRQSQRVFQLVIDNIPQFIFWKDIRSVFLGCNRNFAEAAGLGRPQDIVGKTDYDLAWKREEADFFRQVDRRVMDNGRPELHIIEPQFQADGKQAWLDTNKIPLHDAEERVMGILGTFEDITERKLAEQELERSNEELEVFARSMSHDLKAPLLTISGFARSLERDCADSLDERGRGYLRRILEGTTSLHRLIEDLLTHARLGQDLQPPQAVDMNAVVEQVRGALESRIRETGATVRVDGELPAIDGHRGSLVLLIQNLLENAIKFVPPEVAPEIVLGAAENEHTHVFSVADNGIGVEEAHRAAIFETFRRLHTDAVYPGTGIGLAIVRKAAKIHGGEAWVEPRPQGGSTFCFSVAKRQPEPLDD